MLSNLLGYFLDLFIFLFHFLFSRVVIIGGPRGTGGPGTRVVLYEDEILQVKKLKTRSLNFM